MTIGLPPTFHNALDRAPAMAPLDMQPQKEAPAPDEGDASQATQPAPSQGQQDADQALKRMAGDINNFSSQMEEQQHQEVVDHMTEHHYVIWAWLNGKGTIGENQTQISVKKVKDSGMSSLDAAMDSAKEGTAGGVTVTNITLPIGEAKKGYADYQNRIGDEQTAIIYVLLDKGDEYVVRFSGTNNKEAIEPIADQVMQTLRIKPKT